MDKTDKVNHILSKIADQVEELLNNPHTEAMSEEEIVVLATELVTSSSVTRIEYSSPIATVDRTQVSFMLDEEFEFPIYGVEDES